MSRPSALSLRRAGLLGLTIGLLMLVAFPVYWLALTSVKIGREVATFPPVFFPSIITFENYAQAFRSEGALQFLAHELYHVFTLTEHHASSGVAQRSYTLVELMSEDFWFAEADQRVLSARLVANRPNDSSTGPVTGQSLFTRSGCVRCHGLEGEGTNRGPNHRPISGQQPARRQAGRQGIGNVSARTSGWNLWPRQSSPKPALLARLRTPRLRVDRPAPNGRSVIMPPYGKLALHRNGPQRIARLQITDNIGELLHGHALRIVWHGRYAFRRPIDERVIRSVIRRVDDGCHQVAVARLVVDRSAEDDSLDFRAWQVRTCNLMATIALVLQKRRLSSPDVGCAGQTETPCGIARSTASDVERKQRQDSHQPGRWQHNLLLSLFSRWILPSAAGNIYAATGGLRVGTRNSEMIPDCSARAGRRQGGCNGRDVGPSAPRVRPGGPDRRCCLPVH